MRVGYVYELDAADPLVQSAHPFSIRKYLRKEHEVIDCFPIISSWRYVLVAKKVYWSGRGKLHRLEREPLALKERAWRAERALRKQKVDVLFSPSQLVPTYLDAGCPIVYCNDMPFSGLEGYSEGLNNFSPEYKAQGYNQEALSHSRATKIVYPSEWAKNLAITHHGADPAKIQVRAFGANLPYELSWDTVRELIIARCKLPLTLLLISSDWHRKGGPFCERLIHELRRYEPTAKLIVIGMGDLDPALGEMRGFINKWVHDGAQKFKQALAESTFVILPSYKEAYGMALWEGAAHGLPMIGRAIGGISSIIQDGVTGLLFKEDADLEILAERIIDAYRSSAYEQLSLNAYQDYLERGNWAKFVDGLF